MYIRPNHYIYSFIFIVMPIMISCQQSTHPYQRVVLGKSISSADMEAVIDQPGPIELNSFASANWAVDLSGLVNLNHEKAKAAKLADRLEAIQIFSYHFRHPVKGDYLIDTGVSEKVVTNPSDCGFNWHIQKVMKLESLKLETSVKKLIEGKKIAGVFFDSYAY